MSQCMIMYIVCYNMLYLQHNRLGLDNPILKGAVQPSAYHSFILFLMINLVICFPIASIQKINQRVWQDMTSSSQFQYFLQVSLHPPLLLLVQAGQLTCTKQPGGLHAGCVVPKRTGTGNVRQVDMKTAPAASSHDA